MPLLEHEASRRGRLRVFARAQLPFAIAFGIVAILVAIVLPERFFTVAVLSGTALAAISTILAGFLPWERWPTHAMAVVAVLDLLAVASIRLELISVTPGASLLCIFPVLWLAFGFTPRMIILAVAGTLFISSAPYVLRARTPETAVDWLNVALLPMLTIGIAVAVNIGARQLRRSRHAIQEQAAQLERSLARALDAEALAESILETVDAGVAFYTADGTLGVANAHAADMVAAVGFRLDTPPYAGEHVLQADRRTPIPFDEQIIPRALRGELLSNHLEWVGEAGQQRAILASSTRVMRNGDTHLGTVIVAHDVTELANAIDVREAFLTTVSHELRTPLTSIHGYLELIMDDAEVDAPGLLPALRVVQRNAVELERRVQELLTASDSTVQITPSRMDLRDVAARAIETATAGATGPIVRLHADAAAVVSADPEQVHRAITELVANAVKFTPADGTVDVVVEPGAGHAAVTVNDTGVGMSADELRQAFDKFYRADYARDQAVQGVGLGLPAARAIADAHGGSVTLRSTPATASAPGTTVATFVLPLEPSVIPSR
ncbi:cell wall metabolism sensor histidine kinase WalK [Plantibacter sp. M259]|uniref:sensor histidine kinase n=1 Tax=Plantibacter sp. M259 TaxID=2583822 RepID=UPI00111012EA|nr:ATP-binding protein [Plantibacter sp. M259]